MKAIPAILVAVLALSSLALAGDCGAPKQPASAPPVCACCEKMKAAAPTLEQLVANAKTAKDDQLLDALVAVLNKLVEERKAAQGSATPAAAPEGHQH